MARLLDSALSQYLQATFDAFTDEPFTLAAWFRKDAVDTEKSVLSVADVDATAYHSLTVYSTQLRALSWNGGSGNWAIATASVSADTWFHGVAIFAADNDRRIYLNGANEGTNAGNENIGNIDNVRVGVTADSTPFGYFDGLIAEPAIWNVALTGDEVALLFNKYAPSLVRPANLVAYWPLIDSDLDSAGSYDLTPINGPTFTTHVPGMIYALGAGGQGKVGLSSARRLVHSRRAKLGVIR